MRCAVRPRPARVAAWTRRAHGFRPRAGGDASARPLADQRSSAVAGCDWGRLSLRCCSKTTTRLLLGTWPRSLRVMWSSVIIECAPRISRAARGLLSRRRARQQSRVGLARRRRERRGRRTSTGGAGTHRRTATRTADIAYIWDANYEGIEFPGAPDGRPSRPAPRNGRSTGASSIARAVRRRPLGREALPDAGSKSRGAGCPRTRSSRPGTPDPGGGFARR